MRVMDIMSKDVVYAEIPGTRREVLELMSRTGYSSLPVVKKDTGKYVGMVSLSDMVEKSDEEQLALLVNRSVPSVSPEDELKKIAEIMLKKNIRKLPVVKDGKVVGIISIADIVHKAIPLLNIREPIKNIFREKVLTVWEETPLNVALKIMKLAKTNVLIALDINLKPSGIITEADIITQAKIVLIERSSSLTAPSEGTEWDWDVQTIIYVTKGELHIPRDIKVKDVMTKKIVSVTKYTSISSCARIMAKYDYDQLPVLDAEGNLIGIIFDVDLVKAVVNRL